MPRTVSILVTVVGFALHLVAGFFYVSAGLVVPGPWLFGLWALWVALAVVAVGRRRQPLLVLAIPFVAIALLVAVVSLGGHFLHWQA